jgi:ribosome-binding protein aMBF1 (putative translation factor)
MMNDGLWYSVPTRYTAEIPVRRVAEPRIPIGLALGQALRRLRAAAGFSEEQLGARAGLSPVQIAGLERGEHGVSLAVVERLAGALKLHVWELLREAERERARRT